MEAKWIEHYECVIMKHLFCYIDSGVERSNIDYWCNKYYFLKIINQEHPKKYSRIYGYSFKLQYNTTLSSKMTAKKKQMSVLPGVSWIQLLLLRTPFQSLQGTLLNFFFSLKQQVFRVKKLKNTDKMVNMSRVASLKLTYITGEQSVTLC